jgi:hypothetical protein
MAAGETPGPVLWSDFDGTAVETVGMLNPRNWAKYPLDGVPGYAEFLEGVQEGGVAIGGLVSRRPDILPRRLVTGWSIAEAGLEGFFPTEDQRVLTGDEARKGIFVVGEAQKGQPVGMIDDKPHHIGPSLLAALIETPHDVQTPTITLGVVNHDRSEEYMMRFIEATRERRGEGRVSVTERVNDHTFALRASDYRFRLGVVRLPYYSGPAGEAFAEQLSQP